MCKMCDADDERVISYEAARRMSEDGAKRLEEAGIPPSDPHARLKRKREAGIDTTTEEGILA